MDNNLDRILITSSGLIELLSEIEELKDCSISLTETIDGQLQLNIEDNVYELNTENAEDVSVSDEVIEQVEDINEDAYEDLIYDGQDDIEGGVIKEIAKTIMLGGLVRLTGKLLK